MLLGISVLLHHSLSYTCSSLPSTVSERLMLIPLDFNLNMATYRKCPVSREPLQSPLLGCQLHIYIIIPCLSILLEQVVDSQG